MRKAIQFTAIVALVTLISSGTGFAYTVDANVGDWGIAMPTVSQAGYFNLAENTPTGPTVDVVTEDTAYARVGGGDQPDLSKPRVHGL